jgi:hypothetical protein
MYKLLWKFVSVRDNCHCPIRQHNKQRVSLRTQRANIGCISFWALSTSTVFRRSLLPQPALSFQSRI